ncbi:MAG: hypothetical protein MK074_07330 [Phycisphaerales bacterium]|nr:hypothetical protein [Phycisphaerales bacterium]
MPKSSGRPKTITDLMKKAAAASKKGDHFDVETKAVRLAGMFRSRRDWDGLAEAVTMLRDARREIRKQALASRAKVNLIPEASEADSPLAKGRHLVEPPSVGADARRLRIAARDAQVPAAVVCREPTTRLGEVPVVAIAPGATVRTKIDPPDDESNPSAGWFRSAMEALGREAVAMDQPDLEPVKRVDRLLALLDAVPDEDTVHDHIITVCGSIESTE